jgi:hypothetical protein
MLGDLPGGDFGSDAMAVSADGSIVLGQSRALPVEHIGPSGVGDYKAFVWDAAHGMRDLQEVLMNEYGLANALAGWQLIRATDISNDGLSIVGSGFNLSGDIEAWLVRLDRPLNLPEPASLVLLLSMAWLSSCVRRQEGVSRTLTWDNSLRVRCAI